MNDMFKSMCIQQGYIPSTCTMDGKLAWLLANKGEIPCWRYNEERYVCGGGEKKC